VKVTIFGLGYVGTITAAGLASQGHEVVGVEVDASKVELVSRGISPSSSRGSTSWWQKPSHPVCSARQVTWQTHWTVLRSR
jgi:UDP-glucose 6-dehydrogenase